MHSEYKRIVKNSNKAVLFVHGILGTPNHFDMLINRVPENLSVYNILLDGHGKGVDEFSKTSMKKWEKQIELVINELSETHDEIYIVAHSMGCLLSIEQSLKNNKISKMFFLAAPLKLFLKPQMFINSLRVYFNKFNTDDEMIMAAKKCCGIYHHKNLFKYIGWIPRFLELFIKIKQTRKITNKVKIPCFVYLSVKDEMVSVSSKKILEENSFISVFNLENSTHFYYEKCDLEFLESEFDKFISQ